MIKNESGNNYDNFKSEIFNTEDKGIEIINVEEKGIEILNIDENNDNENIIFDLSKKYDNNKKSNYNIIIKNELNLIETN